MEPRSGKALGGVGGVYLLDHQRVPLVCDCKTADHNALDGAGGVGGRASAGEGILFYVAIAPNILLAQIQDIFRPVPECGAVCKKALKPNGTFISLDVPKESAFGFMYLLAKEAGTFDHPSLNGVMPQLPYPLELCCAGVWHSTEEKIDALKALGFHDFDFYQTLLRNPMYTNEVVEDVVPGYQSGGYVAIIAHK